MATDQNSKNPLRIGIIGVGHMGSYHASVLSQCVGAIFVGVFDEDEEHAKKVAEKFKVDFFPSAEKLAERCDGLIVATPTSTHYEYVKTMLLLGKHVLVEKPFTTSYEEAVELCKIAASSGCNLMVGHVERYNGAVAELPKIINDPILWHSKRIGPFSGRIQDVGVSLDLLIHDIDICLRTVRSKVLEISAVGGFSENEKFEDTAVVRIIFESGCIATFLASRVSHEKERSLHVIDKNFNLLLDYTNQDITVFKNGESQITTESDEIRYRSMSSLERLFIHKENPLKLEVEDFLLRSITSDFSDTEKDLITLKATLEIVKQIEEKEAHRKKLLGTK